MNPPQTFIGVFERTRRSEFQKIAAEAFETEATCRKNGVAPPGLANAHPGKGGPSRTRIRVGRKPSAR